MKIFILICIIVLAFFQNVKAQFPFEETDLIDGAINVNIKSTSISTRYGVVTEKTIVNTTFSTRLKVKVFFNSLENYKVSSNRQSLKGVLIDKMLAAVFTGNNFTRTLLENQTPYDGPPTPLYDVIISSHFEGYTLDPCGSGDQSTMKLLKTEICNASGPLKKGYCNIILFREGLAGDGFRLSVIANTTAKEFGGGGPVGEQQNLGPDDSVSGHCIWRSGSCIGNVPTIYCADRVQSTEGMTREGHAYYTRKEVDGTNITKTEIHYLTIDTSGFFSYLEHQNIPKVFNTSKGTYHKVITQDGQPFEEYTEEATATFTLGLKAAQEVEISGVDDDEYHKFLPIPSTEKEFKPLAVKATIDLNKNMKADSLDFFLVDVTHYLGKSGNYPEEKKADYSADLFFAPQAMQPKNILFVDSFHVTTRQKVTEAIVVVWNSDYAAYGSLEVKAINQQVKGVSKYNEDKLLSIPEDNDHNKIADYWEDFVKIKGRDKKSDNDEFPEKQKGNGDGLTYFEEYRGFNQSIDLPNDGDAQIKDGDHVRTDPDYKDIFINDETGMCAKLIQQSDPFRLNWHFVNKEQMKFKYNSGQLLSMSVLYDKKTLNDMLNTANDRAINYNTPFEYKRTNQYGLRVVFNANLDPSTAGESNMDISQPLSPKSTNFVGIQDKAAFEGAMQTSFIGANARMVKDSLPPYSAAERTTVINNQFEATFYHELGHALGINHHLNGKVWCVVDKNAKPNPTSALMERANSRDFGQECYEKLFNFGVKDCIMRYSFNEFDLDVKTRYCLTPQRRFCKRGEFYIDPENNKMPADDCFGQITVICP